jgi:hypothetical protein
MFGACDPLHQEISDLKENIVEKDEKISELTRKLDDAINNADDETRTNKIIGIQDRGLIERDEALADAYDLIERMLPGVGHIVLDIGFLNDTMIKIRSLIDHMIDEDGKRIPNEKDTTRGNEG